MRLNQYYSLPKQKPQDWMTSLLNFTKHLTVPTSILLKLIQWIKGKETLWNWFCVINIILFPYNKKNLDQYPWWTKSHQNTDKCNSTAHQKDHSS